MFYGKHPSYDKEYRKFLEWAASDSLRSAPFNGPQSEQVGLLEDERIEINLEALESIEKLTKGENMPPSDYKRHTSYDEETNNKLDAEWKACIDYIDNIAKIDAERDTVVRLMDDAYRSYGDLMNNAIKNSYGDPILNFSDKLLVIEGSFVITYALKYNEEFPNSKINIPQVGDECIIISRNSLWLGNHTVAVMKFNFHPDVYQSPDVEWSNHQVPYQDAQKMRRAFLSKQ